MGTQASMISFYLVSVHLLCSLADAGAFNAECVLLSVPPMLGCTFRRWP